MRPRGLITLLVLASLAGTACRNKPGGGSAARASIEVGRVSASWVDVIDELTVERNEVKEKRLKKILAERVSHNPRIKTGVTGRDPLELAVVSGSRLAEPESADAPPDSITIATFTLRTTWEDGWRISTSVLTDLPSGKPSDTGPIIDDLIEELVAQLDLFDLSNDELISLLEERDCAYDDVCILAVRILGERGDAKAVPVLVETLEKTDSSDPMLEDLVGALGRLGDERAGPALVDAFNRADPSLQVAILRAIESVGGKEARLFLEVVASGHDSHVIRELARSALESMDKEGPSR
jgi:hypothetical protein